MSATWKRGRATASESEAVPSLPSGAESLSRVAERATEATLIRAAVRAAGPAPGFRASHPRRVRLTREDCLRAGPRDRRAGTGGDGGRRRCAKAAVLQGGRRFSLMVCADCVGALGASIHLGLVCLCTLKIRIG